MTRRFLAALAAVGAALVLAGCGGGGGSSSAPVSTPTAPTTPTTANNTAAITVDAGPTSIDMGSNPYIAADTLYVSVTVCAPGTSTCQTIDHVEVDTGSVGLRLPASVLNQSTFSALPAQTSTTGNPVGECYGFVDGYIFGSVRTADVTIGGETASSIPIQLVADTSLPGGVPASCSQGGGTNLNTVALLGSNGILGVGVTATDCGATCVTGNGAATYYDCPASGCATVIARAANTAAPYQQLPNPIIAFPVDNNGLIISLPAVPAGGETSVSGTMYFGIGTQSNNALGSATILATTNSSSPLGAGFLTVTYNGQVLPDSYIDSGSNALYFIDPGIAQCAGQEFAGYYCPSQTLQLSASIATASGGTVAAPFILSNAITLYNTNYSALPGLGVDADDVTGLMPYPNSFDLGVPFFFGRNIYLAIEGRNAGGTVGPYFAY